jgi:mannosyl-glycoprotein endo-beta-N-acetylglucosaminidase
MDDAWNGGSCLQLGLSGLGSDEEDAFFRCIWLPVQSLTITPRQTYEATAVCKTDSCDSTNIDFGLSVKLLDSTLSQSVEVTPCAVSHVDLPGGWTKLSIQFVLPTDQSADILAAIGIVVGFAAEDPTQAYELSILIGQLAVFPSFDISASAPRPAILWANFECTSDSTEKLQGILTWEISVSFPQLSSVNITSPEDPVPVWPPIPHSEHWMPSFLYFNVYVQPHGEDFSPEKAVFIGTTGLDAHSNRFYVDPECLPECVDGKGRARFYIQGITDKGEVLAWAQCVFVDTESFLRI